MENCRNCKMEKWYNCKMEKKERAIAERYCDATALLDLLRPTLIDLLKVVILIKTDTYDRFVYQNNECRNWNKDLLACFLMIWFIDFERKLL